MDDPFIYGLLLFTFFIFSLLNSAFNFINQLQLELDKSNKSYNSRILSFIQNNFSEFELSIKIGLYLNLISLISLIQIKLISGLSIAFLIIVLISITLIPVLISIPKTFGQYFSNNIIRFFSVYLIFIFIILSPITYLFIFLANTPVKIFLKKDIREEQKSDFNKDDLNELVSESQKYVSLDIETESEIKLFKNALDFSETKARDCMTPRTEIKAVELEDIVTDLELMFVDTRHSKILIYKDNIDNIIGFIKSKSLLKNSFVSKSQIKSIPFFPETMRANKLLGYFIRTGQNIAVIVDEFGGTSGVITIEDILEEIFGEIQDEHETIELYEKQLSENDFVFSGRLEIDHINEKYHLNIPESEEYETIAGYILSYTESLPQINARIYVGDFLITILKVTNTKLELLKLELQDRES